ncbi:hypothetical protein CHLRE_12g493350v5 [Chlamydomonas reinhardtii]|uniref:Uncharacterized protein n=1 Tax=Chlamydomonas reinhardtii TaxID=3055 RepID=A0A2K3D1V3_CHLRE|nr:uncharacterized protein CHLRE_12g493350v5 [Chlamydomonas reinhardtii]PNW74510.1 hypothetical protein CHLRE_12g493350v5 [Chlamydomonas reinhardtii]
MEQDSGLFTEFSACVTCGTLWKREWKGGEAEKFEIVAKRLKREPHLTDPPNGHRVVFWRCHTCGADHMDDEWASLLATVGVREGGPAPGPGGRGGNPFGAGGAPSISPPQLLRPPR